MLGFLWLLLQLFLLIFAVALHRRGYLSRCRRFAALHFLAFCRWSVRPLLCLFGIILLSFPVFAQAPPAGLPPLPSQYTQVVQGYMQSDGPAIIKVVLPTLAVILSIWQAPVVLRKLLVKSI